MGRWYFTIELACGHTLAGDAPSQLDANRSIGEPYECPEHGATTIARYSGRNWGQA